MSEVETNGQGETIGSFQGKRRGKKSQHDQIASGSSSSSPAENDQSCAEIESRVRLCDHLVIQRSDHSVRHASVELVSNVFLL